MKGHRWPLVLPPDELGAVVHGPLVLGRSAGVVVGVRCVFAHPTGLHLPVVMIASGVYAEAAQRQSGQAHRPRGYEPSDPPGWSWLELWGEVNGEMGEMQPFSANSSSNQDRYVQESNYWVGELPDDDVLRLTVAWPRIGLGESVTVLRFDRLQQAAAGAIPLG
jgi:hypothetical protein